MDVDIQVMDTLFRSIDSVLDSTLGTGTAKVMLFLGGLFGTAWTLQFAVSAFRWLFTGLDQAIGDIIGSMIRMAFIVSCAFNVPWYLRVVVPFVTNMPVWMGGVLAGSEGDQTNQVDMLLNKFVNAVIKLTEAMTISVFDDFSIILIAVAILVALCLGGVPFIGLCIGTLLVLKASTTLFLVVGPIFIAFALFDATRRYFWGWVSVVGGFMLANVLFSVVVGLAINFINSIVLKNGPIEPTWMGALSVLFYFGAFTFLAANLPDQAASVMGGASSRSIGIQGLAGKATGLGAASKFTQGLGQRLFRSRNRIQ